jgi:diguanylate cyclase (GGDEF)-like protein
MPNNPVLQYYASRSGQYPRIAQQRLNSMVPSKISNTIDFDAARLHKRNLEAFHAPVAGPEGLAKLRQQLSLLLQTSLDVEQIINLFFSGVQRLVALDALGYQHAAHQLAITLGSQASHSVSYRLLNEGDYLGELTFRRSQRFSVEEIGQLEALLDSLLFPLRNALLYRNAMHSAMRDPLTGSGNRIALHKSLEHEIAVARRQLQPLSLLMLDIDHFSKINERCGHGIADEVLKALAITLQESLRSIDMSFRYGGEEFVVLLANTSREEAGAVAERLRLAASELQILVQGRAIEVSISIGGSSLQAGEAAHGLLQRAETALVLAKSAGRNCLVMNS